MSKHYFVIEFNTEKPEQPFRWADDIERDMWDTSVNHSATDNLTEEQVMQLDSTFNLTLIQTLNLLNKLYQQSNIERKN